MISWNRLDIMGMPITFFIADEQDFDDRITEAFTRLEEIDSLYSTYQAKSLISQLNGNRLTVSQLPEEVRYLLDRADYWRRKSRGYFSCWRDGYCQPLGLVKAMALQEMAQFLRKVGVKNFMIDMGGDIQTEGKGEAGQKWRIGIRHPYATGNLAATVDLEGQAVATSGTYARGAHIWNPHTGHAAYYWSSVTVVADNIEEADVLATTACAMEAKGLEFIAHYPGAEALGIVGDEVVKTVGMDKYLVSEISYE